MKTRYIDLIDQTFYFPQDGFDVKEDNLMFHDLDLKALIDQYGTPLKIFYLPKIKMQIEKARKNFGEAMSKVDYPGKYRYCYCTKSSHFSFVVEEALKQGVHIETSSEYDIDLILSLYERGLIDKKLFIICNGFKPEGYIKKIAGLIDSGFENVIPVLDNMDELEDLERHVQTKCKLGIRIAAEERPGFEFYTSRLGIAYRHIQRFYDNKIKDNPKFELKMLHFFINAGIRDTVHYWTELSKALKVYVGLKKACPSLNSLNIGGGFPIQNSLGFEYDYSYMAQEIINQTHIACTGAGVQSPDIFTEFGNYTVGETGILIFQVLRTKEQNDTEKWYMIDNSLMTTIPDMWSIGDRFITLPINKWQNEYTRVNIGGLSCDQHDYYSSEVHISELYMPKTTGDEPLYIGFFHVGAYQDSLGGYGGLKHCLLPSPKYILVNHNEHGELVSTVFNERQPAEQMLDILGYNKK